MPLLRRIVILVAVLTAIPVILWTITSFVHSFVGPTRAPNYRTASAPLQIAPMQDVASTGSAQQDAAQPSPRSDPLPAMGEARAATMDTPGVAVPPNAPPMGDRFASTANSAGSSFAAMPATTAMPVTAPMPAMAAPMPSAAAAPATPVVAAVAVPAMPVDAAPAATEQTVDEVPAGEPIKGPIPLPRHRPHRLAMVEPAAPAPSAAAPEQSEPQAAAPQAAAAPPSAAKPRVPLPRARPEAAGPAAVATDTTSPSPIDWIQGLFQQH